MTTEEYKTTKLGDEIYYVNKDRQGFYYIITAKVNKKKDDMVCFTHNKTDYACYYKYVCKDYKFAEKTLKEISNGCKTKI